MPADPCGGEEAAALRQNLERLVELELAIVGLGEQARAALPAGDPADNAALLLRDLRDLAATASDTLERRLKTLEAEQGINPDD